MAKKVSRSLTFSEKKLTKYFPDDYTAKDMEPVSYTHLDVYKRQIYESLEEKMKSIMGTRVQIHRKKNDKGKIEIE